MFFSEECSTIWCLGVEGTTYTMDGDKIVYSDDLTSSPDGIYKTMQVKYGCGADPFQFVWINEREMSKYDENYAQINKTVAGMEDGNVIQPLPPTPLFDDLTAEDAACRRRWRTASRYGSTHSSPVQRAWIPIGTPMWQR